MINWKLRFKNKTTLTSIVLAMVALVYQILGMVGIVPGVSESEIVEILGMIINLLVLLGIVVDPTTDGVGDSDRALNYDEPFKGF